MPPFGNPGEDGGRFRSDAAPPIENRLWRSWIDSFPQGSAELFRLAVSAAPRQRPGYARWIFKCLRRGQPFEDLGRISDALGEFDERKQRLCIDIRDIGHFSGLKELETYLDRFPATTSKRRADRQLYELMLQSGEIETIMQTSAGTVASPESERASICLGRGTRWCTASKTLNSFNDYHLDGCGKLYVLMPVGEAKFQYHAPSGMFVDASDNEVPPEIAHRIPLLAAFFQDEAIQVSLAESDRPWHLVLAKNPLPHCMKYACDQMIEGVEVPEESSDFTHAALNRFIVDYRDRFDSKDQLDAVVEAYSDQLTPATRQHLGSFPLATAPASPHCQK